MTETKTYQSLDQSVTRTVLDNGLTVYVIPKPGFKKMYAMFATHYGGVDLTFSSNGQTHQTPAGVAHFLEHKMFDMPDGTNAATLLSHAGAIPNAYTSFDTTAYYFECNENFYENLRTLLTFVTTPYYTPDSVAKEQGIIDQEIKMIEDSPDNMVMYNMLTGLYAHHPISIPIAGTTESISGITAETLHLCHKTFYSPGQMVLCVCGDVDAGQVADMAAKLTAWPSVGEVLRDYGPEDHTRANQAVYESQMEVSRPLFMLGYKMTPPPSGPETLRHELLGELACETLLGRSSSLYAKMYGEGLINKSFEYGYVGFSGGACLLVGGESSDPAAISERLQQASETAGRQGVDAALFDRLKKAAMGGHLRVLDEAENVCRNVIKAHFSGYDYFTFPELFESLTTEAAAEVLRQTMTVERTTLSTIRPKQ